MTNFMFIILVIIAIVTLIAFFNTPFGKQLRVKAKGRTDEVMRQDASTPEGARDYYNAAIRDKEEFHSIRHSTFFIIFIKTSVNLLCNSHNVLIRLI